jgi:prophage regulatory protein
MESDYFMREPEVRRVSGLSRTTRWRKVKKGTFPTPYKISDNVSAWLASEVFRWRDVHSGKQSEGDALKTPNFPHLKRRIARSAAAAPDPSSPLAAAPDDSA